MLATGILTETARDACICPNPRRGAILESIHWVVSEASHCNCGGAPSALFPLETSPRVAAGTLIRPAISIRPGIFPQDRMTQHEDPRTVLVTGAGRRLGRCIALDFAARGWRVGVHHRDSAQEALGLVTEIVRNGGIAAAFGADLTRLETIAPPP